MECRVIKIRLSHFVDGVEKEDYRNTVMLPPSLVFSYERVKEVLFLLYPKAEYITFYETK